VDALRALQLPDAALTGIRFRETHLEKLYLRLQLERELRLRSKASGAAPSPSPPLAAAAAAATSGPGINGSTASSPPPPPLSDLSVTLAPGFDKYAQIGQPGGDDSAAHEAGYDAFMTAVIFASFAAEAPLEQILTPLRSNRAKLQQQSDASPAASSAAASAQHAARSMQQSPWLGRIPLFRHLMALDLNVDSETGQPRADSLVDSSAAVYLMRGLPSEWRAEDILACFEGKYTSAKRKMGVEETTATSAQGTAVAADDSKMTDVADSNSSSGSTGTGTSAASPLPVIVTAAPTLTWIDGSSVFLSLPRGDSTKMNAFIRAHVPPPPPQPSAAGEDKAPAAAAAPPAGVIPPGVTIEPFAGVEDADQLAVSKDTKQAAQAIAASASK